jgi:hypothetical protein
LTTAKSIFGSLSSAMPASVEDSLSRRTCHLDVRHWRNTVCLTAPYVLPEAVHDILSAL